MAAIPAALHVVLKHTSVNALRLYLFTRDGRLCPPSPFHKRVAHRHAHTSHRSALSSLLNPLKLWTAACMAALVVLGLMRSIPNVSLNYKLLTNNKSFSLFPCGVCSLHHYGDESSSVCRFGIGSIATIDWTGNDAWPRYAVPSYAHLCFFTWWSSQIEKFRMNGKKNQRFQ